MANIFRQIDLKHIRQFPDWAIGNRPIAIHNRYSISKSIKKLSTHTHSKSIAGAVFGVLLQGCTHLPHWGYGPDGQTREEFEHRVEAAFKLQNNMTSKIMLLQESGQDGNKQESILQAEQHMQKECTYLNEYASREMDGLDTGFILLNRVEDSVIECERAARQVESLLKGG